VTSNDAAIAAVVMGLGICRLLSYQVADELAAGRLKIVLADFEEAPWPVHLVHRESKFGASKVRNFIDLLAGELKAHPHLN
jgi:DNA-binding transcriptional LysR family regulator